METDKVTEVLNLLDERLADDGWVNIRLGNVLLRTMRERKLVSRVRFINPAYTLGIGDPDLWLESYRSKHPVFEDMALPNLGFLVGANVRYP